jgi:hypothetical protein
VIVVRAEVIGALCCCLCVGGGVVGVGEGSCEIKNWSRRWGGI